MFTKPDAEFREGFFYEYFYENKFPNIPTTLAYRTKTAKYIAYPDHKEWVELYDLSADPYERKNLAYTPQHSDLLSSMQAAFEKAKASVGYVLPGYADVPWSAEVALEKKKKKRKYSWQAVDKSKLKKK